MALPLCWFLNSEILWPTRWSKQTKAESLVKLNSKLPKTFFNFHFLRVPRTIEYLHTRQPAGGQTLAGLYAAVLSTAAVWF